MTGKEENIVQNVVGRDLQKFEMKIMQNENGVWFAAENIEISKKEISIVIQAVYLFFFMNSKHLSPLSISPTELSSALNEAFSISVPPTMIKKKLTADHEDLELLGLKFDYERTKQAESNLTALLEKLNAANTFLMESMKPAERECYRLANLPAEEYLYLRFIL